MSSLDTAPALHVGPPREAFLSDDWFQRDLEAVFLPRWQFVGHADQLPEPGSFVTFVIGDNEIVVCRRNDGGLGAYHNFCRHRGHRLVTDPQGTMRRNLTCPYHGWTFSKDDGSCLSATRMPKDFDRCAWALRTVWVEEFHGLVFVCLSEERPEAIGVAAASLLSPGEGIGGYDLDGLRLAVSSEFLVEANWKVVKENDDECYHCALNHPELSQTYDPWAGMTVAEGDEGLDDQWTIKEWALIELGRQYSSKKLCAIPMPRKDGDPSFDSEEVQFFWMAAGHMIFINDYARICSFVPLAPERTLVRQWWLVDREAEEGRDYDRDDLMYLFEVTSQQDKALCEEVQRGLRMPRYTPGPLNLDHQSPAAAFYRWYEQTLGSFDNSR